MSAASRRRLQHLLQWSPPRYPLLGLMALALALFYSSAPPLPLRLAGALAFTGAVLMLPVGGVAYAMATTPLYLIPAAIDVSGRTLLLPLHEVALLITVGVVAVRHALLWVMGASPDGALLTPAGAPIPRVTYVPHVLLLVAGIAGVLIAVPEGRGAALREFRWLVVEPLLFYGLLHQQRRFGLVTGSFVLSGALVALVGLAQFAGLDLVPWIGEKRAFSDNVIAIDGVRRVTSVYGHPNNLGLYLERVWPLAAALAAGIGRTAHGWQRATKVNVLFFAVCALITLSGVVVSFSRGAWLASALAAIVLASGWLVQRSASASSAGNHLVRRLPLLPGGALIVMVIALALTLRGGPGGGSTDARLLLWQESFAYLQRAPLGLGLDQFYYYHNPEYGRSLIDPSLVGTSEQFAAHPHNLLLEAWLNLGPVGTLALGWLLLRFYRRALAALPAGGDPALPGALAAMSAGVLHGLVDRFYFVPDLAFVFWLLLAIAEQRQCDTMNNP